MGSSFVFVFPFLFFFLRGGNPTNWWVCRWFSFKHPPNKGYPQQKTDPCLLIEKAMLMAPMYKFTVDKVSDPFRKLPPHHHHQLGVQFPAPALHLVQLMQTYRAESHDSTDVT